MLKRDYQGYERVHDLLRSVDGQHYCTQCELSWQRQPKTFCAGVPVYQYGAWPEDLSTRTQLRRMRILAARSGAARWSVFSTQESVPVVAVSAL